MIERTRSDIMNASEALKKILDDIPAYLNNNFLSETGNGPRIVRILGRTIKELQVALDEKH